MEFSDRKKLAETLGQDPLVAKLAKGDVQEAFQHLKGWYWKAAEMQVRPCRQTMERQTDKWEELYVDFSAYSAAFPANGMPYSIGNYQLIVSKLRAVVILLSHGRCRGALGLCTEHIKAWLRGVKKEKDPEMATSHIGVGKTWHKFACLCTSIWNTGTIPQ